MKRESIDIFYVDSRHEEIHQRLMNWAHCVYVGPRWEMSPMFKAMGYKSNSRQWEEPRGRVEVDVHDGWFVERHMRYLPERHRFVLQWWYVISWPAAWKVRQQLGVTDDGLLRLCNSARDMIDNVLKRDTMAPAYTQKRSMPMAGIGV